MLSASYDHFSISPDGLIYFQEKTNNPLPGISVARLIKGEEGISPDVEILPGTPCEDTQALLNHLKGFVAQYKAEKLSVLDALSASDALNFEGYDVQDTEKEAVAAICKAVYAGMGIVDRVDIQTHIEALTPESRRYLRSKSIRLGPVLAFQPDLNKPAAVRLRAVLWAVFYGHDLPVNVPSDGSVSVVLDEQQRTNKAFYKAIGYPVYGNRAIRIDMLDRVINEVYDSAKEGKFQAQHKMAEWLGCSIPDLYLILEDLGFKKIYDPADQPEQESGETASQNAPAAAENASGAEETLVAIEQCAPEQKPELATFMLKRGKLSGSKKAPYTPNKSKMPPQKKKGKRNKAESKPKKQTSFGPQPDASDSPFAVLAALKDGKS